MKKRGFKILVVIVALSVATQTAYAQSSGSTGASIGAVAGLGAPGLAAYVISGGIPNLDMSNLFAKVQDIGLKIARWAQEDFVKGLRDIIAKRIIDYIVDQTIRWVQGGGEPKFVTDWEGFLKDVANIAFDSVVRQTAAARLCSPFAAQLRFSLLPVQRFSDRLSCTLDQVATNIERFYDDFSQGGWLAYNNMWFNPSNNYFGAALLVNGQLIAEASNKTLAARSEAQAGGGFLSVKKCLEPEYTTRETTSRVCIEADESGECRKATTRIAYEQVEVGCKRYETETPGLIVGKAVSEAVTSDIKWAANIQSWTAALINAVINRLVGEGISGLRSAITGTESSYRPPEYAGAVNQEFSYQRQQFSSDLRKIFDEKQYLLNRKSQSLSLTQDALNILTDMRSRNCQPLSDSEIQLAQSEITRLTGEVNTLRSEVGEVNSVLSGNLSVYSPEYSRVLSKYNSAGAQLQISQGTARKAADDEFVNKQNQLMSVRERSNQCSAGL